MTVQTDLDNTWASNQQSRDAFKGRSTLEDVSQQINAADDVIQALVDSGNFSTIPVNLRTSLNDWWTIIKTARASIAADADIVAIIDWRP